ncbi:MAG: glycoside hydrolase family 65 protein [Salinivirgaceae bacterium]|jgi:maltose phosphorylase|nr:glycoside hydrolase family 65 protein [Salinivirgaceae bacterium]
MNKYLKLDKWNIIEEGFVHENVTSSESIFSIGNGRMGQRANFEEKYSGETLQGNYIAGVYYPDKTKVGWWKNGYPEYFAKVLNAANWIGINIKVDGEELDLNTSKVGKFKRTLNMLEGHLLRSFSATMQNKNTVEVNAQRFLSIVDDDLGLIKYAIKAVNFSGVISIAPYVDVDVVNEDSNYDEKFWDSITQSASDNEASITAKTKKTNFVVTTAMRYEIWKNGEKLELAPVASFRDKYAESMSEIKVAEGDELIIYKFATNVSSFNHNVSKLEEVAKLELNKAQNKHYDTMLEEQKQAWAAKWEESDITIEGDVEAQQAIRFNIFQLNQTYTGEDERLNIGPKGFTGEKYGGVTYWDTEAYCLPFYLATADKHVARNLLLYRYKQLNRAIENAAKLGFNSGAALFPMVTMNGEECHNEWEITFEEIHRNGAIAFAVYNYIRYTDDKEYLEDYGLELLIGISRFWSQRITYSENYKKYVMLGVTGPNEYENNVDNNWYTNTLACWTMDYTQEVLDHVKSVAPAKFKALSEKLNFTESVELARWTDISDNMHYPEDKELGVFLQQDNYLNKEQILVKDLDPKHRPINQNWSWDRILRSCFIKQADTLQGIYLFEENYDKETIERNFDFYEQRTVHESSLSPCVHTVLAAKLDRMDQAYDLYLRTSRLDLDDYNVEVHEGLHITSMAGTWMSVVQGFGGLRVNNGKVYLNPRTPKAWDSYSFKVRFRGSVLKVNASKNSVEVENQSSNDVSLVLFDKEYKVKGNDSLTINN